MKNRLFQWTAAAVVAVAGLAGGVQAETKILNASYDVGREVYAAVNQAFVPYWKAKTGQDVQVDQSHAGSSAQARAILEGLAADVVTFNQVADVERLVQGGFVEKDWAQQFPHKASPFYSLHSILVRQGNPKGIRDWEDLARPGVRIVQVNPKTGGNGRYAVMAYYGYALQQYEGDQAKAREFLKKVLANVEVFDRGGRAATTTFTERGIGDVLVTFESETLQLAAHGQGAFEVVTPSTSVLSEFPVAVVSRVANRRGTTDLVKGYLEFLYTAEGQDVVARNYYRPRDEQVAARYAEVLKPVASFEVDATFGSAAEAQAKLFDNGALVDQLLAEIGSGGGRRGRR